MASIEQSIEVDVPVRAAYSQWTQFEAFPRFMEGVKHVQRIGDKRLRWRAELLGKDVTWDSEILQQVLDDRITWKSTSGHSNAGAVSFVPIHATRTRVTLRVEYEPEGVAEHAASALGLVSIRIRGDLDRFKEFIEEHEVETGGLRNEVHG